MESNDLDREKFELEKQKLELERQKLDFEKLKLTNSSSVGELNNASKNKLSVLSLITGILLAVTPFLPWVSGGASGYGASISSSINGLSDPYTGYGFSVLLFAVAAIVLAFVKNKFVFIPGALALIVGILFVSGTGSHSF